MAKVIMIQGTMSNAGKSLVCAGLCRVLKQDGYKVAPFKSQNMALNSWITNEGLEMGRAQVVQAEAAGVKPSVRMNPVLLKPVTNVGSQVIVMGEVRGNMSAVEYYAYKKALVPEIKAAYDSLAAEYDVIVIEGAGSPAEINLNKDDFVNMGMAKLAHAPVLLVGDIDRGGVFAQLYGTIALIEPDEQARIKGLIINKFRGDVSLLKSGLTTLEELTGKCVVGVLPMLKVDIEDEDSLSARLEQGHVPSMIDIAVIRLPHLSNFTDFTALEATNGVGVRYVKSLKELTNPDLIILPGTKNTMADLRWLRQNGIEAQIKKLSSAGVPVIGICGGYQMLGKTIVDAEGAEGGGEMDGLGLLPIHTEFASEKHRSRIAGTVLELSGLFSRLTGSALEGYEIHMGKTRLEESAVPFILLENGQPDGCRCGLVYGSYLHGFFDSVDCREAIISALAEKKNVSLNEHSFDFEQYKQQQYDLLAQGVRDSLNMELIYKILEEGE